MDHTFDIYSQLRRELDDFFDERVEIAGTKSGDNIRYLKKGDTGYSFNQWEMLNIIDLYYNSKFETGHMDSENQRKLFLNICKFRADVAAKQIDLDVKDFTFLPEDASSEWGAFFIGKEFKYWAKENDFGELLNTCVENFPKYGWLVLKEVKGTLEFVPLRTLRNQQDAESLTTADYVIIEHANMSLREMKAMKNWDIDDLEMGFNERTSVYERYGFAPRAAVKIANGEEASDEDWEEIVDTLSILTLKNKDKGAKPDGNILFIEEIKRRPFIEGYWSKIHGRLMGIGEIENQLENQRGANMSFNLFRRQLLWSSKKIFQSSNPDIAKNLVKDVRDGDVLEVGTNGAITAVDMTNRAIGDFTSFSNILEANSDKKSFTYEAATGESMGSGTPFRLGVLLSNAVNSHFDMKREKLGLIMKKAIVKFIIPTFKRSVSQKHIAALFADEEGFEALKMMHANFFINDAIKKNLLAGTIPDVDALKAEVDNQMKGKRHLFTELPDDFYDDINYRMTLTVTGEEVDVAKKLETLTTLYTTLMSQGDTERANRVLARIMSLTGENFDVLAGLPPAPAQALPGQQPGAVPSPIQPSTLGQPATEAQVL